MDKESTIVLIQPTVRVGKERQRRIGLPLGLLAIGTPLDLAGYRVKIIDQYFEPDWKRLLSDELKRNPICVGISSKTGPQIRYALEASSFVKSRSSVPVVWGGVHPTLLPEQTLANENIDIIVRGEGEESFFALVKCLEQGGDLSGVKGIFYKENGQIKSTPRRAFIDLNAQPSPSYHLVDMDRYKVRLFGVDHVRFCSSRGCPYRCGFCYNVVFSHKKWRALSPERTVEELTRLRREYGIRGFTLADDFFFFDLERVRKILTLIVENRLDIVFSKLDTHGGELSKLDDSFLELMHKAGCKTLVVGVESASERILKLIRKNISVADILDFNRRVQKFDIVTKYCFMLGFPTETRSDIDATVSFILKLLEDNPNIVKDINLYTPYPGTELYDLAIREGLKPPERLEDWISYNWSTLNRANTPWITDDRETLLRMLHFSSLFLEKSYYLDPIRATDQGVIRLARIYHPFAKLRMKYRFFRFPIEIKLAELFGYYPRQA